MTTIENPAMKLHDMTEEQFVNLITHIIVTTIANEKCDDAIQEVFKQYVSDYSLIDEGDADGKIESAIDDIDWSEKISEAIDENDAFDLEEKVRMALDTPITELRKDIHDLKVECNSLREHNRKTLDVVSSLLELVRAINNK